MKMSEIYNGSQWAHDIFLVNKAVATEYVTGRSSTLEMSRQEDNAILAYLCLLFYDISLENRLSTDA